MVWMSNVTMLAHGFEPLIDSQLVEVKEVDQVDATAPTKTAHVRYLVNSRILNQVDLKGYTM